MSKIVIILCEIHGQIIDAVGAEVADKKDIGPVVAGAWTDATARADVIGRAGVIDMTFTSKPLTAEEQAAKDAADKAAAEAADKAKADGATVAAKSLFK